MSDWNDATDPVQPVRERERRIGEKRRALVLRKRDTGSTWLKPDRDIPPSHHVYKDFDEER